MTISLDLSHSATRSTIKEQLIGQMDENQQATYEAVCASISVPDQQHYTLSDVMSTVLVQQVPAEVQDCMCGVYGILTQAEAAVHQLPPEETHFHEVGSAAGIANAFDICAAFYALGADGSTTKVQATPVQVGSGTVTCAHGEMPIPAPATAAILQQFRIPVQEERLSGELCTPTSAALIAYFVDEWC